MNANERISHSLSEQVAFHFIPLKPGPDHQVDLLLNLMERLILKYDLSDLFLAAPTRPALRASIPNVLKEVVEKGGQEVIFIDGLARLYPLTGQKTKGRVSFAQI